MAEPQRVTDPTGLTVAHNVRRIRERQNLSTYQLSRRLTEAGRTITPQAVGHLERCERRIDAGDLMALAAVLQVSPIALLLPQTQTPHEKVELTGGGTVPAETAWLWARALRPLRLTPGEEPAQILELYGLPAWLRARPGADRE